MEVGAVEVPAVDAVVVVEVAGALPNRRRSEQKSRRARDRLATAIQPRPRTRVTEIVIARMMMGHRWL